MYRPSSIWKGPGLLSAQRPRPFLRETFDVTYGARIEHFLPTLMALRKDSGRLLAVLGLKGRPESEPIQLVEWRMIMSLIAVRKNGHRKYRFHAIVVGEQAKGTNGSGLGLSIVKRIADLHGAGIVLGEGLNGKGLRVKVVFAPA